MLFPFGGKPANTQNDLFISDSWKDILVEQIEVYNGGNFKVKLEASWGFYLRYDTEI